MGVKAIADPDLWSRSHRHRDNNCPWWLRSPGRNPNYAAYVSSAGIVYELGDYVLRDYDAVRPALWIDLNS